MPDLRAHLIDTFRDGDRRVMRVTAPGTIQAMTKTGPVDVPYRAGDVVLVDAGGNVVCGPVGLAGVTDLAERILDGDERAVTDPLALPVLATAIVAFQVETPADPEPLEMGGDEPMTNRGKRLHAIIDALNDGLTTADRLAASTGVTVRTIYRDMQMLKGIGVPIIGEAGVGYVLRPHVKIARRSRHD